MCTARLWPSLKFWKAQAVGSRRDFSVNFLECGRCTIMRPAFDNLTLFRLLSHSLCSLGLRHVRDSCQMYLDVFRDPFESEIWSSRWVMVNCQKVVPSFDRIFRHRLQRWLRISMIGLHRLVRDKMFVYLRPQGGPLMTVLCHCQKVGAWYVHQQNLGKLYGSMEAV